jgi:hypothetical protein
LSGIALPLGRNGLVIIIILVAKFIDMANFDLIIEPDLKVVNGDIAIADSDEANSFYIIYAQKGQLRINPLLGVGIVNFTNAPDSEGRSLAKVIREEHLRDGYKLKNLTVEKSEDGSQNVSVEVFKFKN